MENGAFAPKEQMLHFRSILLFFFKYMIFPRRQKALLWSKGLKDAFTRFIQASLCKIQGLFKDFSRLSTVFKD